MKTLIIYNDILNPLSFLILEGDFTKFNRIIVNSDVNPELEKEFCDWMYDKETGELNFLKQWSNDISVVESKDWDKVAICTWIP